VLPATLGYTHSHAAGNDDEATQALIAERCTRCHVLDTVTARRASPQEWHEIVQRMVMQGAQVSEAEAETIADYLARHCGS
jgi:cytochrome c2